MLNQQQIAEAVAAAEAAQAAATVETAVAETAPSISSIGAQSVIDGDRRPRLSHSRSHSPRRRRRRCRRARRSPLSPPPTRLRGTTATGIPTGPGIVAVDPTVIPLGTRMTIPGYGEAVAADTGGAIKGLRIDVWVATAAEAAQWQWQHRDDHAPLSSASRSSSVSSATPLR